MWKHAGEGDAVHLILVAGDVSRHIKFKRPGNSAMYDFIVEHGAIPTDPQPDTDPATSN